MNAPKTPQLLLKNKKAKFTNQITIWSKKFMYEEVRRFLRMEGDRSSNGREAKFSQPGRRGTFRMFRKEVRMIGDVSSKVGRVLLNQVKSKSKSLKPTHRPQSTPR